MALFHYPKGAYKRRFNPRKYKRYRSFKHVLQHEFSRVCVYCREPDSVTPKTYYSYSVDHYRPKGVPRFKVLENEYANLYYCCGPCNSRKNDYWPYDEKRGPLIINPCDHDMSKHLRFNSISSEMDAQSVHGDFMISLLQLNHPDAVEHRKEVRLVVATLELRLKQIEKKIKLAEKKVSSGKMSTADFAAMSAAAQAASKPLLRAIDSQTGNGAPAPLKRGALQKSGAALGLSLPTPVSGGLAASAVSPPPATPVSGI